MSDGRARRGRGGAAAGREPGGGALMGLLFVDCDDTLVLWTDAAGQVLGGPHPYGGGADEPVPNEALIEAIVARRGEFEGVVLWSGGGRRYAAEWLRYLTPHGIVPTVALNKDPRAPTADDLCIEDDPERWPFVNQCTWQEFVGND